MCLDPVTLGIGLALSGAGAAVSSHESSKNAESIAAARNKALMQSLARQRAFADEARGMFNQRMGGYQPDAQAKSLDDAQTARTDAATANMVPASPSDVPISGTAPDVVKGVVAKRLLDSFTAATDRAKAAGRLGGYGDNWLGGDFGVADTARRIGTINNFAQHEARLLPMEQDFAQIAATKQPSILGPLLSTAGNIFAAGAGKGWTPFGGSPVTITELGAGTGGVPFTMFK